ncbi:MAG TPA: SUMF1/EgtB/PvdO family nonheme iron enzyme [Polyangiaceae bacterium]|nr:SUMF1/EgtB/PvdO family nonheme iron enzyme [Polyangiaceae bacterium]
MVEDKQAKRRRTTAGAGHAQRTRVTWFLALPFAVWACTSPTSSESEREASLGVTGSAKIASSVASTAGANPESEPAPNVNGSSALAPPATATSSAAASAPSNAAGACPDSMQRVPGGEFWVGTPGTRGLPDEHPRFLTRVPDLCVDTTEVTVEAYTRCVEQGQCKAKARPRITCNFGRPDRADHPMNCLDWQQAASYCKAQGARLPSEVEWEYFARGGAEYRNYSWGNDSPDGRTCWKRAFTCPVKSFAAGAFGLYDVTGNVWEWTASDHGDYPWPPQMSPHKVYRGGSWSRRFEKWLVPSLRNRDVPTAMGSHLGFRCVTLAPGASCAYGVAPQTENGAALACLHGVDDAECPKHKTWNGVRCAREGEPKCPNGTAPIAGFGCGVSDAILQALRAEEAAAEPSAEHQIPKLSRSSEFDADCMRFQPSRPKAYRLDGATHEDRNLFARDKGCKNRDVGANWNSVCCP